MDPTLLRYIVIALICYGAILLAQRAPFMQDASKLKRALVVGGSVFVALLLLEVVWPRT